MLALGGRTALWVYFDELLIGVIACSDTMASDTTLLLGWLVEGRNKIKENIRKEKEKKREEKKTYKKTRVSMSRRMVHTKGMNHLVAGGQEEKNWEKKSRLMR